MAERSGTYFPHSASAVGKLDILTGMSWRIGPGDMHRLCKHWYFVHKEFYLTSQHLSFSEDTMEYQHGRDCD